MTAQFEQYTNRISVLNIRKYRTRTQRKTKINREKFSAKNFGLGEMKIRKTFCIMEGHVLNLKLIIFVMNYNPPHAKIDTWFIR